MPSAHSAWTTPGSSCAPGANGLGALLITNLLTAITVSQNELLSAGRYPPDVSTFADSYDFIVIGTGSAGAVVANRLSEVTDWNVLVLEAGGDPSLSSEIPPIFHTLQETDEDWQYSTEPQEFGCLGMKDRMCHWPRGKVLGGSSILNAMLYVRGNRRDYDNWAKAGNPGWSYEEVLPYFIKSEDFVFPDPETPGAETYSKKYHGTGSYQHLKQFGYRSPIVDGLIDAAKELGYKIRDVNGEKQTGFTLQHGTIVNGTRSNTAKAFLASVKDRKNLHVSKYSHVTKILIDPETKTAQGVEFIKNNQVYQVKVTKEVIVSAGTMNSPQLLMLSGVGPEEHLQELGIPVIQNLRVGENLQDHMQVLGPAFMFNLSNPQPLDPLKIIDNTYQYMIHRSGPMASIDILQFQGFISTKYAHLDVDGAKLEDTEELDYPDIQYQHIRFPYMDSNTTKLVSHVTRYTDEMYEAIFGIPNSKAEIYIPLTVLQRPKSRGFVKLRSKDPLEAPIFDPRYLSDPRDVQTLVEGVKVAMAVGQTKTMKERFEAQMNTAKIPGCEIPEFGTDEYWACAVRKVGTTIYHQAGTCKMGPRTDPTAVVDSRLKVHGIKGLRVIDASIMPTVVTGNTHAPVIMIGERGADFVKQDWLQ
ncbi:Glucose dehydrogenase [FAD, quinone] [Blattella germanica]|nr:Glucose dehydrogenase [FAD, quinone] [Blattella germanica]